MNCGVCGHPLGEPIYTSGSARSLTSLCEMRDLPVTVLLCGNCGHLSGPALPDTAAYYDEQYRILLDHDEEDQIYEVDAGSIIYRTDHQVRTLRGKLKLPEGAALLDYGCAKASTPRRLLQTRGDLAVHLFDVSSMYTAHWDRFLPAERYAIHQTPASWTGRFDVVTSFFALEHIPHPLGPVQHVASLLKDGGVFYGLVPNTFTNPADFVVVDHVNHFTQSSLMWLLNSAGFGEVEIDASAHRGAYVFVARKTAVDPTDIDSKEAIKGAGELARYWQGIADRIRAAESTAMGKASAIYGSGFYGSFIYSELKHPAQVQCFLDASPYQQTKKIDGKAILEPKALSPSVDVLYVGLNPSVARKIIADVRHQWHSGLELVFLDSVS